MESTAQPSCRPLGGPVHAGFLRPSAPDPAESLQDGLDPGRGGGFSAPPTPRRLIPTGERPLHRGVFTWGRWGVCAVMSRSSLQSTAAGHEVSTKSEEAAQKVGERADDEGDEEHGGEGDVDPGVFTLDADVTGQTPEPGQSA